MNDVSVILPLPVQVPDPVTDGVLDELQDMLLPVQEEDLPQGVLDLLAALILRNRPATQAGRAAVGQSMTLIAGHGAADVVRDKALPTVPVAMTYPQANKPVQQLPPQLMTSIGPTVDRMEMPVQGTSGKTDLDRRPSSLPVGMPIEHSSSTAEPMSIERAAHTPIPLTAEPQLPETLLQPQVMRQSASVVPPSIPLSPILPPMPAPDMMLETLPGSAPGLLQVPFHKGTVSGQVTISRMPDDSIRNLQLSPSNALVFEQLKVPFEQVREPAWRLTDSGGEQQRQGSQQSPDDEQAEQSELPA
ncbi:SpaN/EivJ family type III secretion system needle length determinant [Pseudomonas sp. PGPR40]|uniref:SpaN/EivJ family type III secretion system needle length determinant n=1 Tax=Pseudomonas sp. PGPR40 TaxID=2913476 RepID=UPI001ED9D293|nr:invasion protein [Pseudomonas sp. PGPR40]